MRRNRKRSSHIDGNRTDPLGMGTMLAAYLESLAIKNFSEETIKKRRCQLNEFIRWSGDRSLQKVDQIQRPILQRYQRHLFYLRTRDDKPLSFRTQHVRLSSLRNWFAWMTRNNYLLSNPASELELPKLGQPLPKNVLSHTEAETVLNQADLQTPLGVRDRAIMETLYSTGIRRGELAGLDVYDLHIDRGVLMVRAGKGNKDRYVPIGDRALAWTLKYQDEVRPNLLIDPQDTALYIGTEGSRLSGCQLGRIVRRYIHSADIGKSGSCHLFRHSMATAMLENGADIRYIQSLLGHACLDTTQVYTRVSIRKLKEIHTATHPAKAKKSNNKEPLTIDNNELLSELAAEEENDSVDDEGP